MIFALYVVLYLAVGLAIFLIWGDGDEDDGMATSVIIGWPILAALWIFVAIVTIPGMIAKRLYGLLRKETN